MPSKYVRSFTPKHKRRIGQSAFSAAGSGHIAAPDSAGRSESHLRNRRSSPARCGRLCAPAARWWRPWIRGLLRRACRAARRRPSRMTRAGSAGFDRILNVSTLPVVMRHNEICERSAGIDPDSHRLRPSVRDGQRNSAASRNCSSRRRPDCDCGGTAARRAPGHGRRVSFADASADAGIERYARRRLVKTSGVSAATSRAISAIRL